MKKVILLLCLGISIIEASHAQQPYQTRCGTESTIAAVDVPAAALLAPVESDSLLIIPVVFHIIHQGGPENISNVQVLQALQQLNNDFNRRNHDTLDIPPVFQQIRGTANIAFRLAKKDPDGHCTDGINRVFSPLTSQYNNWITYDDGIIWDHTRYLNVFVAKDLLPNDVGAVNFTLPGLANLQPVSGTGNPNLDFVSMRYDVMGFSINGLPMASHGHILTEEFGHSLALQHIWVEPGCNIDDAVADTPLQDDAHYEECIDFPFISCNNMPDGDNFQNFMDYTNCKNMFTKGQVERMRTCLANNMWRQQLCSAQNLEQTGVLDTASSCMRAPVASFGYGNYLGLYYPGKTVSFHDASNWEPDSWKWSFEGGVPAVSTETNPSVVFPTAGTFKVKLLVSNAFGVDSVEQTIVVREELFYPETNPVETFDDTNLHAQIKKHTLPNANAWQAVQVDALNGNYAMYLDSCKQWASSFETATFRLGNTPALHRKLEFKVAHATSFGVQMVNSSLRIVARNTNTNDWVDYYHLDLFPATSHLIDLGLSSSTLRTATVAPTAHFVPTAAQWKKLSFDLPESLTGDVVFAFHWGSFENANSFKGLYIDSVSVTGLTSAVEAVETLSGWSVSPNPATGYFDSHFTVFPLEDVTIRIFNTQGQLLGTFLQKAPSERFYLGTLPKGMYVLMLQNKHETRTTKLIHQGGQ